MTLVDKYNQDVSKWTRETKRQLKLEVIKLTTQYSGHSRSDLDAKVRRYAGEASKINFAFPFYMAFVHKGAGKGYGGSKTGLFTRANGSKGTTNASSMGKMGTGARRPKPWFNPVVEERFPRLEELVAVYHGGKVALNIQRILVN
ncbi:hypothetical protein ACVWYN_002675 [Pedobacter sp. UYP24]